VLEIAWLTLAATVAHAQISADARDLRLGPVLGEVRRENVLTVGECDNFLGKGGIINFVTTGGQVRFQINLDNAAREKLVFSSKLLQLALPVGVNLLPSGGLKLGESIR
jgi:hypothetical protein